MRIASRIVGIALALGGLGFLTIFVFSILYGLRPESVLSAPDRSAWIAASFSLVAGVGLILFGVYYLRLDIDALDETQERPSRFAPCFIAHGRALKIIAQVGLVISLVHLGAACLGVDWPGRWTTGSLTLAGFGLAAVQGEIGKPQTGVLKAIEKAGGTALLIVTLLWGWSQWSHQQATSRISQAALIVLLFAWEALFFQFGKISSQEASL